MDNPEKKDKNDKKVRNIFFAGTVLLLIIVGILAWKNAGKLKHLFGLAEQPTIDLSWGNAGNTTTEVYLGCPSTISPDGLTKVVGFVDTMGNYGTSDATGVTVKLYPRRPGPTLGTVDETMPAGSTITPSPGTTYDPATLTWTIGKLAANGGKAQIHVEMPVPVAMDFSFEAEVLSADQHDVDSTPGNRTKTGEDDTLKLGCPGDDGGSPPPVIIPPPVTPQNADLSLTKSANPASVTLNQNSTMTIQLNNAGPYTATNVVVKDILPAGMTFISAAASAGTYDHTSGVWSAGSLVKDYTATLTVVVKLTAVGSITNTAEVTASDQPDPDSTPNNHVASEDDQASATVTVTSPPVVPTDVTCSPATQSAAINSNANFTAVHGDGTFAWTVADGTPASGSGASFTTKFSTAGQKTITVTSAGKQATCAVTVTDIVLPPSPQADLSLTKVAGNPTPALNANFTYSLVLSNAGPNTATGVVVADALPAGVTFVSANASQGTYDAAAHTWTIGSVPVGATPSLIITVTANASGTIVNTAEVKASDQPDPDSTPNNHVASEDDQASATVTVSGPTGGCTSNCGGSNVDVGISKTVTDPSPPEGDSITYTLLVTNHGPLGATNVTVNDMVPNKLTFVTSNASQGTYDSATGAWTIGAMANGASATLTITATVNRGTATNVITNTATVTIAEPDSNPANNTASVSITPRIVVVGGCINTSCGSGGPSYADLSLTKIVTNALPTLGQTVSYVITLVNSGPLAANGITVGDVLPSGLTYNSATASQGSYDRASGVWTVGSLNSSAGATLTISVTPTTIGTIINTTEVTASSQPDPDSTPNNHVASEDDQASATMTVSNPPSGGCVTNCGPPVIALGADLSLTKSVNNDTPQVGQHIIYTITVINSGPVVATGISVKDILPGQLKFSTSNASQGTYDSSTAVWSVGTIDVGDSVTLQLSFVVKAADNITNTAEVYTSDQPDPDSIPNNNNPGEDDQASVLVKSHGKPSLPAAGSSTATLPILFGLGAIVTAAVVRFRRRSFARPVRSGSTMIRSYIRYE